MNELAAALNRLAADPSLPRETLPVLTELYNKIVEMKDLVEGKGLENYTPKTYHDKVQYLVGQYLELMRRL
jgi:hypothetical protein